MPTNNTENIYSTEFENDPTPIPSSKIGYDNTESGLTATTVQGAIDELDGKIKASDEADEISYDNTESGLEATNVQSAIDEIADVISEKGYHIVGMQTAAVTATKMSDYYTALVAAINAVKAELKNDEAIILKCIDGLVTNGTVNFVNSTALWIEKNTDITTSAFVLNAIYLQAQGAEMKLVSYIFGSSYNHQTETVLDGTNTTITQKDSSEDAISSTLRYIKVKK